MRPLLLVLCFLPLFALGARRADSEDDKLTAYF
jgi:hypothetical protein